MKQFLRAILTVAIVATLSQAAFAANSSPAGVDRRALLKQIAKDVMLKGALADAKQKGERCRASLVQATKDSGGAVTFEAQINCSIDADEYTGGGDVLMINVKGRSFETFLDQLVIKVNKAG